MKECPICGSKSFDDMKTCFGCMHRFEEAEENQANVVAFPITEQKKANPGMVDETFPLEEPPAPVSVCSQQLELPSAQARYELLISLQPVGA